MDMPEIFTAYAQVARRGAELLLAIKETSMDKVELAAALGISQATASRMISTAKVYETEELAHADGICFEILRDIAITPRKLTNPDVDRHALRAQLFDDARNRTVDENKQHVTEVVEKLNGGYTRNRKWHLRYSATPDADGMSYIIAKLPAEQAEHLRSSLTPEARALVHSHNAVDEAEGHAKALYRRIATPTSIKELEYAEAWENPENPRDLRQRPCIIIPDWELTKNIDGTVVDTNGVVVNIDDLANRRLEKYGFAVTVYKDHTGVMRPQDVLEIKRLADVNDRFISILSHLVCQHPDCTINAIRCETHHIQSFAAGGKTTPDNLCPLCRKHNLKNDDGPTIKNGRVITDPATGLTHYQMPDGTIRRNRHRANNRGLAAYAARMGAIEKPPPRD